MRLAGLGSIIVCTASAPAFAQGPPVQLPVVDPVRLAAFSSGPWCVDATTFKHRVGANLDGRDPFSDEAPEGIEVTMRGVGPHSFTGEVVLRDAAGKEIDRRQVKGRECSEVAEGLAVVVAGWRRPIFVAKRAAPPPLQVPPAVPAAAASPPPSTVPATPLPPAPAPRPPARKPRAGLDVGVAAASNLGLAPKMIAGVAPWVSYHLGERPISFELAMRGMGSPSSIQTLDSAAQAYLRLNWTYVSGVFAANIGGGTFFGGPVVEIGNLTPHADTALSPLSQAATFNPLVIAAGFRAGAGGTLTDQLGLRTLIEGEYLVSAPHFLLLSRQALRAAPTFSATLAIGLTFHLWSPGEGSH